MRQLVAQFKLNSLAILLPLLVSVNSSIGQVTTPKPIVPVEGTAGRVLTIAGTKIAIEQPLAIEVPEVQGKLVLGFIHSGYTDTDPDGKQATLNVTVQPTSEPVPPAARDQANKIGLVFNQAFTASMQGPYLLDIAVPSDRVEESRIRKALGLPRTLPTASSVPLTIHWNGISGNQLYALLTNNRDGLTFTVERDTSVKHADTRTLQILPQCINSWWDIVAPGAVAINLSDVEGMATSLAEAGCVGDGTVPYVALSALDVSPYIPSIAAEMRRHSETDGGGASILKRSEASSGIGVKVTRELNLSGRVHVGISVGSLLIAHPELVKDLSSGSKGLDAIKGH